MVRQQLDLLMEKVGKRSHNHLDAIQKVAEQCPKLMRQAESNKPLSLFEVQERLLDQLINIITAQPLPQWYSLLFEDILSSVNTLDREVTLPQSEDRYHRVEGDALPLAFGKMLKRGRRRVRKGVHVLANGARKIRGQSPAEFKPERHVVRLQAVFQRHIVDHYSEWEQISGLLLRTGIRMLEQLESGMRDAWTAREIESEEEAADEGERNGHVVRELQETAEIEERLRDICELMQTVADEGRVELDRHLAYLKEKVGKELEIAVATTGTLERAGHYYRYSKVEKMRQQLHQRLVNQYRRWERAAESLADSHKTLHMLVRLRFTEQDERQQPREALTTFFKSRLDKASSLKKRLDEIAKEIRQTPGDLSKQNEERHLAEIRDSWDSFIQLHIQEPLDQENDVERVNETLHRYINRILLAVQEWPESIQLPVQQDFEGAWPQIKTLDVPWRRLGLRHFRGRLKRGLSPDNFKLESLHQQTKSDLLELGEIVEVNIDSALESMKNEELSAAECRTSILEGLDRARNKRLTLHQKLEDRVEEEHTRLEGESRNTFDELVGLVVDRKWDELQKRDREFHVKQKAVDWRTRLRARWAQGQDAVLVLFRFAGMKIRKQWRRLRRMLGFETQHKITAQQKADLSDYLNETGRKIAQLPFIYRRLFDFEARLDDRFYAAPRGGLTYVQKAYESWKNNFNAAVAVVGEKGAGKTAFIHRLLDELTTEKQAHHLRLDRSIFHRDQLVDWMAGELKLGKLEEPEIENLANRLVARGRKIIVIENVQNAYLRTIGGFEAVETLLEIMAATRKQVFWVVSGSRYAWDYLQRVMQFRDYFSHMVDVDKLDEQQIRQVIMSRHRASGFELVFEAEDAEKQQRSYRKLMDRPDEAQEYLRDQFFEKLVSLAEGNASIAMLLWLRSIREVGETHLLMAPIEAKALESMEELTPEVLFILAMFVLHDTLTADELASAMNQNVSRSRLVVSRLHNRGLLEREGDQYQLNHLVYRQTIRALRQHNIIH